MNHLVKILIVTLSMSCTSNSRKSSESKINISKMDEVKYAKLLNEGIHVFSQKKPEKAMKDYFNPIIQYFLKHSKEFEGQIFCSRSKTESIYYSMKASNENKNAVVLSQVWAEAFFIKGYILYEMKKLGAAKYNITRAVNLSPANSLYLSELGNIYHLERKWEKSLKIFTMSEKFALSYSPDDINQYARALRGSGFSLVELGRYDEAEKKYLRCLEINKNDRIALKELAYIRKLKKKII